MLIRRSGLVRSALDDPDNRVPLAEYLRLLECATDACDDPAFALHFGAAVPMRDISLMGLVAEHAESPAEGCELHNRYARLTLDEGDGATRERMSFVRDDDDVWVEFNSPLYTQHPQLTESTFARCISGIRALYASSHDGARWPYPHAIHFTHAAPAHRASYDALFGVPITFGSTRNAWLMDDAFLAVRQQVPDTYTAHALRRHADELLARLGAPESVRGAVEQLLLPSLHTHVGMEAIAVALGLSRQTLHRRLRSEGTTFERIVDDLRRSVALKSLTQQRLPVKRVAHDVGFSDATAFSRAFRRWTGASPRGYLRRQSGSGRRNPFDDAVGEPANDHPRSVQSSF